MIKRILIYGDSNVRGYMPGGDRLPEEQQWVRIVQGALGQDAELLQHGLPARIAGSYETNKPYLNGQDPFEAIVRSSLSLHKVVIALGTNDLKRGYDRSADDIVRDLLWYKEKLEPIDGELARTLLYILPPNFIYREGGMSEEVRVDVLRMMTDRLDPINYLVANDIQISKDGVHFAPEGHATMARLVRGRLG